MVDEIIIILGSTNDDFGEVSPIGKGRLKVGYELSKTLENAKIILTGGFGSHFNNTDKPYYYYANKYLKSIGGDENLILAKISSKDTIEDAHLSYKTIKEYRPKTIFIVTSKFHEERVKYIFNHIYDDYNLEFVCDEYNGTKSEMENLMKTEKREMELLINFRKSSKGSRLDSNIYSKVAAYYDKYRYTFKKLISDINEEISNIQIDGDILEVGCGTGNYTDNISRNKDGKVIGMDSNEKMLNSAKSKFNFIVKNEDVNTEIPFKDASMKFVYNINFIHCVDDIQKFFDNVYRLLKTEGAIYTATHSKDDYSKNTFGFYFPETVNIETNITPTINSLNNSMLKSNLKDVTIYNIREEYLVDEKFYLACKHKVFSALHKIPESSFAEGLEKLKMDCKLNTKGYIHYTIIKAKKI
ncbi:methyltransferase domain-containing protein [Winogradskyella sp.]|uniref:methyltransferase domain-containing protein n=1 Tax=Winogradskyella sp. TaxID=1883156 RepID=UPI003BA95BD0